MEKSAQWSLVAAAWFLAVSVTVFGYLAYQRWGHGQVPVAAGLVQADGSSLCPVTGKHVMVTDKTPHLDYQGRVYYFSADTDTQGLDARTRFLMDPDRYLVPARVAQP